MGARPLTLRCSRCKKHRDWEGNESWSAEGLTSTGRVKRVRGYHGHGGLVDLYEIKHQCGHVMWSNHSRARALYIQATKENK